MNAKEYLQRIRVLDNQIKNKKLELEEIHYNMQGVYGISYEPKETVSSNPSTDSPQARLLFKYMEYQEELQQAVDDLMILKREAMLYIDQIDDADCIDLLYKRYFQFMKWEEIAVEMKYAYRSVIRLHGRALQKLDVLLENHRTIYKSQNL